LLSERNSGFRKKCSAVTSLLETTHKLFTTYDRGLSSRIVFMDISKAFDQVIHSGLIYKLEQLGIDWSLLNLLSSYPGVGAK